MDCTYDWDKIIESISKQQFDLNTYFRDGYFTNELIFRRVFPDDNKIYNEKINLNTLNTNVLIVLVRTLKYNNYRDEFNNYRLFIIDSCLEILKRKNTTEAQLAAILE